MVRVLLVPVHGHALTVPAKFTIGGWRDGARRVTADSRALLEGEQLLGAERLVVDLSGSLDKVLQMGASEEVAEVDEFAVGLILNYDKLVVCSGVRGGDNVPLMMPHLFWRPRTFLPFTTTVRSEPTTAKGRSSYVKLEIILVRDLSSKHTLMEVLRAASSESSSSLS